MQDPKPKAPARCFDYRMTASEQEVKMYESAIFAFAIVFVQFERRRPMDATSDAGDSSSLEGRS